MVQITEYEINLASSGPYGDFSVIPDIYLQVEVPYLDLAEYVFPNIEFSIYMEVSFSPHVSIPMLVERSFSNGGLLASVSGFRRNYRFEEISDCENILNSITPMLWLWLIYVLDQENTQCLENILREKLT